MTWQSGGGGAAPIPGLTSDGANGIIVQDAVRAGNQAAPTVPDFHAFYGSILLNDVPGSNVDGDALTTINQNQHITSDSFTLQGLKVIRQGTIDAGQDYGGEMVLFQDNTTSVMPLQMWVKNGVEQLRVDIDGIRISGKIKMHSTVAHVLGAYSGNAVPVYDQGGTLLGYMPLYA